jgi:hypothetical protein
MDRHNGFATLCCGAKIYTAHPWHFTNRIVFALHYKHTLYDDDDEPDGILSPLLLGSICFPDRLMVF